MTAPHIASDELAAARPLAERLAHLRMACMGERQAARAAGDLSP